MIDFNLQIAPQITGLHASDGLVEAIQHGDFIGAVVHFGNQDRVGEILGFKLDGGLVMEAVPVTVLLVDGDEVLRLVWMDGAAVYVVQIFGGVQDVAFTAEIILRRNPSAKLTYIRPVLGLENQCPVFDAEFALIDFPGVPLKK